ncbi:MAG: type II toxin-antitoxin system RelE/ParE family toxin [Gemmatimonadetes bacterium]|nr:type II toxin-antitoxin system RelE/ParE family toxin [Gemmatimonadota bacterium]
MIISFRNRGLKRLYDYGSAKGIRTDLVRKITHILSDLDAATKPSDLDLPGYRLHPLKGSLKEFWSVSVSANWRIIFRFEKENVHDVDLVDYH